MSVDIKTLRIGSHVEYEGERMMVYDISAEMNTPNHLIMLYQRDRFEIVPLAELSPIPITPELLKELGFKWRKDSSCWRKYQNYDGENYDWGIYAYRCEDGTWCFSLYLPNFLIKPQLYAKHLHELEGQLAYYGVELIKE